MLLLFLLSCLWWGDDAYAFAQTATESSSGETPSNDDGVPVWEIALAAGSGALALLLCLYSIMVYRRRNKSNDGASSATTVQAEIAPAADGTIKSPPPKEKNAVRDVTKRIVQAVLGPGDDARENAAPPTLVGGAGNVAHARPRDGWRNPNAV